MNMDIFEKLDKIKSEYLLLSEHVICNSDMPQITLDIYVRVLKEKSGKILMSNSKLSCEEMKTREDRVKLYACRTILRIEYELIQHCLDFINKPLEEKFNICTTEKFYSKIDEIYGDDIKDIITKDIDRLNEIG